MKDFTLTLTQNSDVDQLRSWRSATLIDAQWKCKVERKRCTCSALASSLFLPASPTRTTRVSTFGSISDRDEQNRARVSNRKMERRIKNNWTHTHTYTQSRMWNHVIATDQGSRLSLGRRKVVVFVFRSHFEWQSNKPKMNSVAAYYQCLIQTLTVTCTQPPAI